MTFDELIALLTGFLAGMIAMAFIYGYALLSSAIPYCNTVAI